MTVHASPNAPTVDLLVDGAITNGGFAYPNNTAYPTMMAGTGNVKINAEGTSTNVINANLPITDITHYTVFAMAFAEQRQSGPNLLQRTPAAR